MSETERSEFALAALATVAIPGLNVTATRPPASTGADFDVVTVIDDEGKRWVVRAPKRAAAGAAMEGEVALLSALETAGDGARLPFAVPRPAGYAALPEGGRAMVYPKVPGRPLNAAALGEHPRVAGNIGRALAGLHSLDTSLFTDTGIAIYDADSYRQRRLSEVDEAAKTGHVPASLLRRWEAALERVTLWRFVPCLTHGDMTGDHVLTQAGAVSGVIDWTDSKVADPADDLAWLFSESTDEGLETVLEAYADARSADDYIGERAMLASELALARWLMHGVRVRDGEVIDDAISMLGQLALDLADAPGIGTSHPIIEPVGFDTDAQNADRAEAQADTQLRIPNYEGNAAEDDPDHMNEAPTTSIPRFTEFDGEREES